MICNQDGWEPAPANDYAMCKLGAWDREIPRCVRPGCPDPDVAEGVETAEEMGGAIVRFYCLDPSQVLMPSGRAHHPSELQLGNC